MNEFKSLAHRILKNNRATLDILINGIPKYESDEIWDRVWRPMNSTVYFGVRYILDIEIDNLK